MLDEVYEDRNLLAQLAAALARMAGFDVGIRDDPDDPDWPVLYIELPTGQVSWHLPKKEILLHLQLNEDTWDGYSSQEKRSRIRRFLDLTNQPFVEQTIQQ